jgi:hypothetical protein
LPREKGRKERREGGRKERRKGGRELVSEVGE